MRIEQNVSIYRNLDPIYSKKTGTNKNVTNAISENIDNVKKHMVTLKKVVNTPLCSTVDRAKYIAQYNELNKLICAEKFDAAALQKCARATKHIFRDGYKATRNYYGKNPDNNNGEFYTKAAWSAYQAVRSIQYNLK